MDPQETNIKFISSLIHVQKCKIRPPRDEHWVYFFHNSCIKMQNGAKLCTIFKAYFYQQFILFTVHHLIHLIQSIQLCTIVHNSADFFHFWSIFWSVAHNDTLRDFLMMPNTILATVFILITIGVADWNEWWSRY